ncbi:MAG: SGNH/GDSL hydrolase family protein [Puia sp.]|nr:SGNH/GDSL hydrolase family protein [Puia sp.]
MICLGSYIRCNTLIPQALLQVKHIQLIVALLFAGGFSPGVTGRKGNSPPVIALSEGRQLALRLSGDTASRSYLALGDSYTIGQSVEPAGRYPVQVVKDLVLSGYPSFKAPEIIAATGWTTGDLVKALNAIQPNPPYEIVTLLIGVNDQFQGRGMLAYRDHLSTLLQKSIILAGDRPSRVLVLSIPDYSVTPFARDADRIFIAAQIDSFNALNCELASKYKVRYLDITAESRKAAEDPSLIAADGLHFSGKEYAIWARMMAPVIGKMLK